MELREEDVEAIHRSVHTSAEQSMRLEMREADDAALTPDQIRQFLEFRAARRKARGTF